MTADPRAVLRARHRFAARPASYCDPSWLPQGGRNGPQGVSPRSRLAARLADRWLIDRLVQPCIDPTDWSLPGVCLALLPDDRHRELVLGLGLQRLGLDREPGEPAGSRVEAVVAAASALADRGERLDGSLLPRASTSAMAIRLGEDRLMRWIAPLPASIRGRWCLRLAREVVRPPIALDPDATLERLAALEHGVQDALAWSPLPCW